MKIVYLLMSFIPIAAGAQEFPLDKVNITSPNAASLGKYADFPVNYHTGLPQISIPIYTVSDGPLELPISVSYHPGGHKVLESSSWVGLGWALNAGGVITRTVKGAPDDRGLVAAHTQYGHFHDYGYNSYLFRPGGAGCGGAPCPTGSQNGADDMGFVNGILDGEPDLYFFNFGKYSGKFFFRDDRTPVLYPQEDFQIEPILEPESPVPFTYMSGFIITTPDGVKYCFGKNLETDGNINAIEITRFISSDNPTPTGNGVVSAWYLNKIVTPDSLFSIKLTYSPDSSSNYSIGTYPIANTNGSDFMGYYGTLGYNATKQFIQGVRLKQVIFSNGTVTFNAGALRQDVGDYRSMVMTDLANTNSSVLGSVDINNSAGFCKRYTLFQSYFSDNTSSVNGTFQSMPANPTTSITTDKLHLRLDSVQESSCDLSLKIPTYKFVYFSEKVPRTLTFGQDHWGYYNGVNNNQTLIPTYTENYNSIAGADRDPHWPAMRGGALQRITYPTGGYTDFDYEPHDTYGTTVSYSYDYMAGLNVGYGNQNNQSSTQTLTAGVAKLVVTNIDGSGLAQLELFKNGVSVGYVTATTNGQTNELNINVPSSGSYVLTLSKSAGHANGVMYMQATHQATGSIMVGGLRVKTIKTNDALTSTLMVDSFSYKTGPTQSSGILYGRPVYVSVIRNDIIKMAGLGASAGSINSTHPNGCLNTANSPQQPYFKSANSIFQMQATQGNHIGYNEVRVSHGTNGYSLYQYYGSNYWDYITTDVATRNVDNTVCPLSAPNYPAAPAPFEFKRGEIKSEQHFNNSGILVQSKDYIYFFEEDSVGTPAYIAELNSIGYMGTEYELKSARKVRQDVTTSDRDEYNGIYITKTNRTYYGSKFHNQPTQNVVYTSYEDSLITKRKYVLDYRLASCDGLSSGYQTYKTAYDNVIATYTANRAIQSCSPWSCLYLAFQQYRFDLSLARQNFVSLRKTNFTNSTNQFDANHRTALNNALSTLKPILQLQEDYHNSVIEEATWRNQNLTGSKFVVYDYSSNPSTKVYPTKIQTISVNTLSSTFTASTNSATAVTKDGRYSDESTYKYSLGNLVEITNKDGLTTSFIWGLNNNYPIVKAVGVDYATLLGAYNAVSGNLTTLRSQTSLANAFISTYDYLPMVGMTLQTNENKQNTYYEYDVLGRLKYLKDHDSNVVKALDYKYQTSITQ